MLVLSTLHTLLAQVLSLPDLHTAILSTPSGQLVCYASEAGRPKDEIRVIVGLSGEIWQEAEGDIGEAGMVDSELGRIVVLGVDDEQQQPQVERKATTNEENDYQPMMLLTLNAKDTVDWDELQVKGKALAKHLAKSLTKYRQHLISPLPKPGTAHLPSPTPMR